MIREILTSHYVREFMLKRMSNRLANVFASLGEQVKVGNEWGESEPFVRRVQDFMSSPVITVHEETPVQVLANTMIENSISSVMVVDHSIS